MRRTLALLAVLAGIILIVTITGYLLPVGHTATAQRRFDRSVGEVWSLLTDIRRYPEWRSGTEEVEVLSSADEAVAWVETWPRNERMPFVVTESDAPRRLVIAIADESLPFGGSWTYELEPIEGGCTLKITEHGEVYNPIFRFVSRLFMDETRSITVFLDDLTVALTAAPVAPRGDLDLLVEWMTGSFSSAAQARADADYADIRLEMVPIWTERTDGAWLYVEQASASSLDRPYRQRVYRVHEPEPGVFVSDVYTLASPLRFAGAWREPSPLAALTPDSLALRDGCSVHLVWLGTRFAGATRGSECESELSGASYATSDVKIAQDEILSLDRGYNADHVQTWGATKGPYVFRRVEPPPVR